MAKSKIIKDLANGSVDTLTALKRVKVLLSELDNAALSKWVDYEITGYPTEAELPSYRVTTGSLIGSYFKGSMVSRMVWKNVSIPLGRMPENIKESFLRIEFYDGVSALRKLEEEFKQGGNILGRQVPADYFPHIAHFNDDPYMMITSASVSCNNQVISNILAAVENRLLDILLILEQKFGILDDLDLDLSVKTAEEINEIAKQLVVLVYNDHSVQIGDGNKIKESNIASCIEN